MTPKEIIRMDPDARLALEARARAGDVESVNGWVMVSAWRLLSGRKDLTPKERLRAFNDISNGITIKVEA
jgi:hypothetical protein